ncbi:response regulator transcription factor [Nostoc sp. FACHB-87]|uniref:response regulator transcription factor n=1 Tax=Nostocales TaxID=1161 RepID=UPI0016838DD0|nr:MULTISPECIES: response regulator transcription factor [Nostocales]MBD2303821.1 response regulator transcription factor [Nostoc sp. FACHB-190]MBD2458315.1 response regulator transcription factor [Nostoc sp. FACHB-87]MBD2479463.1 response regulator transcription factor [Anabaena sp. FACHB-83]MBD2491242.1 response regulator transcription factor [Aulosira sp. FACHB-615]
MIRIVIIEDESLTRLGIKSALSQEPGLEICGEASNGNEGIKVVADLHPDIVLVDIGLPDMSGLDVIYSLKQTSQSKIIALTYYSGQDVINAALQNGADSYILKKTDVGLIKQAITCTYNGNPFIDPEIARRFLVNWQNNNNRIKGKKWRETPTKTELEILKLIGRGFSNDEIGKKLYISVSTVKSHASNLFSKLGVRDRTQAIIKGKELGYLESEDLRVG